jgi:type IV secretion system protein VirB11
MVAVHSFQSEMVSRGARMLRTTLGPSIAAWLEDPIIVEVMLNPDGRLWVDRLSGGLADSGERLAAADGERIVRLVAHHVGAEVHAARPRVSAVRSCKLHLLVVTANLRDPEAAIAVFSLEDYVVTGIIADVQAGAR